MNYLKQLWQQEDKFRPILIIVLAVVVLGLSIVAATSHSHSDANKHVQPHSY